jgi:malonyl-CoA decarboxylase
MSTKASAAAGSNGGGPQARPAAQTFFSRIRDSLKRGSFLRSTPPVARQALSLCHALLSERGEVSGARIGSEIFSLYESFDNDAQTAFFDGLVEEFSPNSEDIWRAATAYRADPSSANLGQLQRAVEPSRQEVFRRLNVAGPGVAALVRMRRDVLRELDARPHWQGIDADLLHLFRSWFNRGFLELRQIEWRTSAVILEQLIKYEAVHQIQGWHDLRRRLQADRRCYGLFHPALPDELLIFIEVALTKGMGAKVQTLLDPDSPVSGDDADTATCYSITNCQEGLRGVSFGSLLIKQVAEHLRKELPRVKTIATLSPIPGFRKWLNERAAADGGALGDLLPRLEEPAWWEQKTVAAEMKDALFPLCAYYLAHAKRGREPLDAVARFHLGNGAKLDRLNWLGDTSPAGMRRSVGLTVNYVYDLADIERNHEAYSRELRVVASSRFERLARKSPLARNNNGAVEIRDSREASKP